MPAKEVETSDDFNNSDEFQDVECEDSDDSFVSSLDQVVGNDTFIRNSSSVENWTYPDDGVNLENTESNGLVLIEEILDKVVEKSLTDASDNWSEHVDGLEYENSEKPEVYRNEEVENSKAIEADLKGNSMKITFYCESVNKLMSDPDADEFDELIQDITPTVDN